MKVAITCDYLLEKNYYTEIIALVCEFFPDAKVYTFAHRVGAIQTRIEQRPVQSTVLSKKVFSEKKFYAYPTYQLPLLAKNVFVACKYDLIINISNGLSQGFKKCDDTKQLTFLLDWNLEKKFRNNFWQKFFFAYLERFARKSLEKVNVLWVANESMKKDFPNAEVVAPPFKMSDYALFPKDMYPHNFYLIDTTDLSFDFAQEVVNKFDAEKIPFQFIGKYSHLKDLIFTSTKNHFFGERCAGEHAPLLAASKAYISFNRDSFPRMALGALSTGRPVILHQDQKQWVSGEGVYFVEGQNLDQLTKALKDLDSVIDSLQGEKLRAQINCFHEANFRNKLQAFLNSQKI